MQKGTCAGGDKLLKETGTTLREQPTAFAVMYPFEINAPVEIGERFVNTIQRVREDMPDLLVLGTNVFEKYLRHNASADLMAGIY